MRDYSLDCDDVSKLTGKSIHTVYSWTKLYGSRDIPVKALNKLIGNLRKAGFDYERRQVNA